MTDQERAVMQQALEALEAVQNDAHGTSFPATVSCAITDLCAALAQEQPEPSGYCTLEQLVVMQRTVPSPDKIAIYTAPPKAEPAQGPVGWMNPANGECISKARREAWERDYGLGGKGNAARFTVALGPIRAQRPPLTDKDMLDIIDDAMEGGSLLDLVRAVERKVRGE